MSKSKIIVSILLLGFGMFMFIYGERDDSPGAQGLGVLLFCAGIYNIIKSKKKLLN